jgi:Ca2+-binding RTX toxin-like protein
VEILKVGPCSNLHQTARRPDPGTFGGDMLLGTTSADTFSGLDGDDCLFGKGANDMLSGGVGNDFLEGNFGNDRLQGEDGNDRLVGSPGSDSLDGGAGNDLLNADDRARDVVQCGPGHDRASVDRIDSVSGCEVVKRVPAAKKGKRPRRKR